LKSLEDIKDVIWKLLIKSTQVWNLLTPGVPINRL